MFDLAKLRTVINESLRVQRGGAEPINYVDVSNALTDIVARQNHVVFGRRGCGKTLLLQQSAAKLPSSIKTVHLNCEDFKNHSFPNVLIEILDALFAELEKHLSGWFGRKKRSREIIRAIRQELSALRIKADQTDEDVKESSEIAKGQSLASGLAIPVGAYVGKTATTEKAQLEKTYKVSDQKIKELHLLLPKIKAQLRDFFEISSGVKAVFLQVDDFYHLRRIDQPFVADYLHRLCKDVPLYFKIATLRHASVLFSERGGQPTGAQERHDFQPINVDYTFTDFSRTETLNRKILHQFGSKAGMSAEEVDDLFKGTGFQRLVMAGGGVPRDFLSLFLEVLQTAQESGDTKIGKDDVRLLSKQNFERRIQELKQDSEGAEQDQLLRGMYVIRKFCLDKKTNGFCVSEQLLQQEDRTRELIYRLLDYRIIHSVSSALTHKSQPGTFQAFVIDIGCYAHMRTLEGKFSEVDISAPDAKEKMRSSPVLDAETLSSLWATAPSNTEAAMLGESESPAPTAV
jgi:hypothetical protein